MSIKHQFRALKTDTLNSIRYGHSSPQYGERLWIKPAVCRSYLSPKSVRQFFKTAPRKLSGKIVTRWPVHNIQKITDNPAVAYCIAHWSDGLSWQASGAIDIMMENIAKSPSGYSDGCRNRQDVISRFAALDRAWDQVQSMGRLQTRQELIPGNFRETGGILIHIGPDGEPVFAGAGCHRMAMALMLEIPFPAQIGCVHISALNSLPALRLVE